ncbi:MAG: TIGR02147 family protein [Myxococcales bacterium]|nr:TIGR02147 family protein [Myxococcales bacterium]
MTDPQNTLPRPDPLAFDAYRPYLLAMIAWLRVAEPRFSYRWFARRAGFSAPNYLKLVAEGDRSLALASVDRFAKGLGLDAREHAAFERLVRLDHAATDAERMALGEELRAARAATPVHRLAADAYDLYARWWTVVIRELCALAPVGADAGWFARMVRPALRPTQARAALDRLLRLGLVREVAGRLRPSDTKVSTGGEVVSLAVRGYHRAMLGEAANALDQIPRDVRHVSSLTVPLTARQYAEVTRRVAEFRRTLLEGLDEDTAEARRIYQVELCVFPVSEEVEP